MEWGRPENFIWLWAAPGLVAVYAFSAWRRRSQLGRFGDPALVRRLAASVDPLGRWVKRTLMVLVWLLVVLALCQPHWRKKEGLVEFAGADVFLAVDVSKSMLARDIAPTRLDKVKLELSGLIDRLKGHRVGIIAFAGDAYIQCPLTSDRQAAKLFLSTLHPNLVPAGGTRISRALDVALQAYGKGKDEPRALVVLTDGEELDGDPFREAEKAKQAGVRVYAIGIGTPDGSTLPASENGSGVKRDASGQVVISRLNESLLKKLAQTTGGEYYRASARETEIESIARHIESTARGAKRSRWAVQYEESYQQLVLAALLLLWLEAVVSERRRVAE
ncbi:MAG: hypothetical protein MOGMAGMI_01746 [Candidatus Omnitrophica bacterium]|nr:hypothetical protein [Candidatus Omnitrophota bacterium]